MRTITFLLVSCFLAATPAATDEVERRVANNGNLVLEDLPPIPEELVEDLKRWQNVRSAQLLDWTDDGDGIYVANRQGRRFAYQSTRRNGASNDIWLMRAFDPETAELVLPAPDGTWWGGWYMNATNEGHGYKRKENRDIYEQAVVMFLARHLAGER